MKKNGKKANKIKKSEKKKIENRRSFSILLDQFKMKRKTLSKREEILLGTLILTSCGALGYYGFINGPQSTREAILKSLDQTQTKVVEAKSNLNTSQAFSKDVYMETEVEGIVNNHISNDPNVAIVGEEFEDKNEAEAVLKLTVDHIGTSGELAQFLEGLENIEKPVVVERMDYQKDVTGKEESSLTISIPYKIVDGTLKSKTFMVAEEELATVTSPAPKEVPKTKTLSSRKLPAPRRTLSLKPRSLNRNITSNNQSKVSNRNSPLKNKNVDENKKDLSMQETKIPTRESLVDYKAPEVLQYSVIDSFASIYSMDGLKLDIIDYKGERLLFQEAEKTQDTYSREDVEVAILDGEDNKKEVERPENYSTLDLALKEEWIKVVFSTPNREGVEDDIKGIEVADLEQVSDEIDGEGISNKSENNIVKEIPRVVCFNTDGIYLPKNGRELSLDVRMPLITEGDFEMILSNLEGKTQIIKENRRVDLQDGYYRVFFTLPDMDGSIRASELRYKFLDKEEVYDEIILRNFQILSNK